MTPPSVQFARTLVDSLIALGVVHFCVCPGNRSAPLVFALGDREDVAISVHVDERAGAFFALGRALAERRPVVLLCTSGSAGAHFLPAVAEAAAAGVPLIVITADRPTELHDCGADQTMPQAQLFAGFTRHAVDLDAPAGLPFEQALAKRVAVRAIDAATANGGGVAHINARFREPLEPPPGFVRPVPEAHQIVAHTNRTQATNEPFAAELVARVFAAKRPLLIAGPGDTNEAEALLELAAHLQAPILVDALSGGRSVDGNVEAITTYDAILRNRNLPAALVPDLVIRTGAVPTSKALRVYIEELAQTELVVIDPDRRWREPGLRDATFVHTSARALYNSVIGTTPRGARRYYFDLWQAAHCGALAVFDRHRAAGTLPDEAAAMNAVLSALQSGDRVHVASSMPVRDIDLVATALPTGVRVTANRGVNGIDGTLSTTLGLAAAHDATRTFCVVGDLATLHDIGGLAAAADRSLRATIVVVNNGGGGIFGFLPAARHAAVFERYFLTAQQVRFEPLCDAFGVAYRATTPHGAKQAIAESRDIAGVTLVEIACDRETSRAGHVALWAEMAEAAVAALACVEN